MTEKYTFLILICFVLVTLNNGYRVRREADDSLADLSVGEDLNDHNNHILYDEIEEEINGDNHEHIPADDIDENFNQVQVEELGDNNDDDGELGVTDSVTDDLGLEGSQEENFPAELCDVEGSKVFLPITNNCSQFFDCTNKEGSYCPQGMWFDPNYVGDTFCQFPEVICAADNNICDCAEKYPPPPPDPLIEQSVSCLNDNRFHLTASQVDCGRYFICHNDMKYRMECRHGLHYDSKTEMCDYPEVVNCRIPDPDCPAEGIKFLPDSTRCEVFYFCVHGFKTKQACPFYHIWDIRSSSCKRQDEAICHLDA